MEAVGIEPAPAVGQDLGLLRPPAGVVPKWRSSQRPDPVRWRGEPRALRSAESLATRGDVARFARYSTRGVARVDCGEAAFRSVPFRGAERCAWAGRLPWLTVDYAEVRLLNGDVFTVEGTLDEVESKLSDAARSGQSRIAWFTEYGTDGSLGVNPAHVATLKVSEISD